ncbi:MAG: DUF2911 domain-containing protein [Gemmatimonadetes bacterium]|nr:DUF2911 domain-containing protein [Gemmatimonadota bacterium]
MRHRTWIVSAIILGLVGTCAATGVSLVPASLMLGPCLRDWTSPSSYGARGSPLATVDAPLGDGALRLCYGRPSMRGRAIYGALVPWDSLWRMGANEPTRLYLSRPATVAGIPLEAGRYALYLRPGRGQWMLFVNRSVRHWGNDLSLGVRAHEVGSAPVPVLALPEPVETLTVRRVAADSGRMNLAFDWERTRVVLRVSPR